MWDRGYAVRRLLRGAWAIFGWSERAVASKGLKKQKMLDLVVTRFVNSKKEGRKL